MATMTRLGTGGNQEPATPLESSMWEAEAIMDFLCRQISRNLDWKQSSQNLNKHFIVECQCHLQWLNPLHHNASLPLPSQFCFFLVEFGGCTFSLQEILKDPEVCAFSFSFENLFS